MTYNRKDLSAAAIFFGIGLYLFFGSFYQLQMGTAINMGPGYFPALIGIALGLVAVLMAIGALGQGTPESPPISWRGVIFISLAPVVFGLTVRGLGLAGASFLCGLCAAFAGRRASLTFVVVLAAALTLFCLLVFSFALGVPTALVGSWLRG